MSSLLSVVKLVSNLPVSVCRGDTKGLPVSVCRRDPKCLPVSVCLGDLKVPSFSKLV